MTVCRFQHETSICFRIGLALVPLDKSGKERRVTGTRAVSGAAGIRSTVCRTELAGARAKQPTSEQGKFMIYRTPPIQTRFKKAGSSGE